MNSHGVASELVRVARELVAASDKVYNTMMNVGKAKYVVNYHDGVSTHRDGSPFFAIALFSNKKAEADFIKQLHRDGYKWKGR